MKKAIIFISLTFLGLSTAIAQVGIGTTTPDASAGLEIDFTDKGFLPPRMTTLQRNSINSPAEGLTIYNTDTKCLESFVGLGWRSFCVIVGSEDVINPQTGQVWMDRNLGASQVATSSTDANSYGDLYQWGRAADGHQFRSNTCPTNCIDGAIVTNRPNTITETGLWDGKFILISETNRNDWVNTQTDNAWNVGTASNPVKSITDPCPSGYRLPTEAEWDSERLSWAPNSGAFDSLLKLPMAGSRLRGNGNFFSNNSRGRYWSSTVSGSVAKFFDFGSTGASFSTDDRADGLSVRCIKN